MLNDPRLVLAAALAGGYLLGSIPFGLLLTRAAGLGDIRKIGSGNIGATNVLRTGNRALAALTVLLDGGKGALAVVIAGQLAGLHAADLAGLGAVLGHLFPVWLGFRGGKGVATGLGVLLAAHWMVGFLACMVWLGVAWASSISSAAALAAFAAAPLIALTIAGRYTTVLALAIALLIYYRHIPNIRRLLAGNEPQFRLKV